MATLTEIVFEVLNTVRHGRSTNNEYIDERLIEHYIHQYRSLLIRRDFERNGDMGGGARLIEFEQVLPQVKFRVLPSTEGGAFGQPVADRNILISETRIPDTVALKRHIGITFVGPSPYEKNYGYINYHRTQYATRFAKYTANEPRFTVIDDYIYIINPKDKPVYTEDVSHLYTVKGVFENPKEAADFGGVEITSYPITGDMQKRISDLIIKEKISVLLSSPNDLLTNLHPDEISSST